MAAQATAQGTNKGEAVSGAGECREALAAGAGTGSEGSLCQKACAADTRTSKYPNHVIASSFGHAVWGIVVPSPPHSIRALWPSLL